MNRVRTLLTIFVFAAVLAHQNSCTAQSQEKAYAIFMLNFARGVQWPDATSKVFTVGVVNYPPLVAELNQVFTSAKLGNKKIQIREYTSADEIDRCEMLFIPAFKSRSFESILLKIGTKPTLIFTNKVDMARKGSGVNFIFNDGKLKFELNCKAIEKRGMKIPASLKGLGILVE
jgi:hypothetical protein